MSDYQAARDHFLALCDRWGVPVPTVGPHEPTDPCDFTDGTNRVVRLNAPAAEGVDPMRHAAHVFGHYVCDLHEAGNVTGDELCDQIADLVGHWAEDGFKPEAGA